MTPELASSISIFVLALLVGFEVISKIPTTLHTPMMSGANSIHGVVLVGAILVSGLADNPLGYVLAFLASAFAAMNVVGGYVVTDRMLGMFRGRQSPSANATSPSANAASPSANATSPSAHATSPSAEASRTPEAAGRAGAAPEDAKGVAGLAGAERGTSEADGSPSTSGAAPAGPAAGPDPGTGTGTGTGDRNDR
ncbi:NAD(P) transhydrogenase subunit alpha [Luteimicrobium sp. NPDC057192]|uniref:NAD(P) transhydrogenase subunit alpha n=1 Tax=Luteimicrobium sp. NPDC057192 TaxID=3346042 RepID=UPI0036327514